MSGVPFVDLKTQYARLKPQIAEAIQEVLDDGRYILGPAVTRLESELADYCGVRHAISCSSGTDAIIMPLIAYGIGPGDAVFVPSFTFTASAEAIILVGASPVFVDVEPDSFNLDLADLDAKIATTRADGKLTPKAILAVDLFGLPADWDELNVLAEREGMNLIDDAAQSFGGIYDGKRVGALAPVSCTSFFPAKPLGCYGDGGAIFTDDDDLAELLKSIRVHGQGADRYEIARIGINGRLDSIQAAILSVKLPILDEELAARDHLASVYDEELKDAVTVPKRIPGRQSAWAQYTIKTDRRAEIQAALNDAGIPSAIYYPKPMHLQAPYLPYGGGEGSLPVSETICHEVMSLPMHPYLPDDDARRVAAVIRGAVA
ncbi:aminotransferase DegT [Methyloceanibacter methanicus]|uniref:Aminotransferase DegT n=1 Tax=Methyloceanibacter methanicus TaxID=1774968 RepID=A0A1E3W616_9HYPH|nr:DegT/DnrJ/EryC1/StrS family aminotransferase [Methyloceanibacter methanicus]ODS01249.1 aminotransferase DegT [Methyloceanibacter methanicus]